MEKVLIPLPEVSEITGFSLPKLRRLIKAGKLPGKNESSGDLKARWYVNRVDLEAYLAPATKPPVASEPTKQKRTRIDANVPQRV